MYFLHQQIQPKPENIQTGTHNHIGGLGIVKNFFFFVFPFVPFRFFAGVLFGSLLKSSVVYYCLTPTKMSPVFLSAKSSLVFSGLASAN